MQLSNNIIECSVGSINTKSHRLIEVSTTPLEKTHLENTNVFDHRILKAYKNFSFPWPKQAPVEHTNVQCSIIDVKCHILSNSPTPKKDYVKIKITMEIIVQAKFLINYQGNYHQYKRNLPFRFSKVLTLLIPDKARISYKILEACCSTCEIKDKKVSCSFGIRTLIRSKMPYEDLTS